MKRAAALLAVFALAACSSDPKPAGPAPELFPREYREEIKLLLQKELPDPTNIKQAQVTEPMLNPSGLLKRYYSCVKFNARDQNKNYVGLKEYVAIFFDGRLNQFVDATPELCSKAAYRPYPEIEKMCLGTKCT